MKKMNKKGGVIYYILVLALFVSISYGLYLSVVQADGLDHPGASSQIILSTIELSNRVKFYIDVSIDQAIKSAILDLENDAGFFLEKFEHMEEELECGEVIFPLLNKYESKVECFPDYIDTIEKNFNRELRVKTSNFEEISLHQTQFTTSIVKRNEDLVLTVSSSPIKIPIYADFISYYDHNIVRSRGHARPTDRAIRDPDTSYMVMGGIQTFERSNPNHPDSIVLHYTAGGNFEGAYQTLLKRGNGYHYIIDKDGTIYDLADESKMVYHAGCGEPPRNNCVPYNARSIGVSFVNRGHGANPSLHDCELMSVYNNGYSTIYNKCWEKYTDEQLEAGIQLVADIIQRQASQGRIIRPTRDYIKTHEELSPSDKTDPGPMFNEDQFVMRVRQELEERGQSNVLS